MRGAAGWTLIRSRSCRQSVQDRYPNGGTDGPGRNSFGGPP